MANFFLVAVYEVNVPKSMGWCKKDIILLLRHWRYVFLALTYQTIPTKHRLFCLFPTTKFLWARITQSLATDMRRLFLFNVATVVLEESDDGHRIKRALYIGIKRLCREESDDGHRIKRALYIGIKRLWRIITKWGKHCPLCRRCNGLSFVLFGVGQLK